ncbi:MAG: pyocin knob domain-containing protein, partial [Eubacterium sp.]|nr:pyocin knob domain-containing protein [Eubacterium sp.]
SNHIYGFSASADTKTLGSSVINSAKEVIADLDTVLLNMKLTVYNGSFYHKLTIKNESKTILTTSAVKFSAGTGERTFTLTSAERTTLLNAMAKLQSFTATLSLATYTSSACNTQVGNATTKTCKISTSLSNSGPIFTDFKFEDIRAAISSVTGNNQMLVQGCSNLRVICNKGSAQNGASITNYSFSIGNLSKTVTEETMKNSSYISDLGTISTSGNQTLTVTCTDSRGYSKSVKKPVTILPYSKPKITSFSLRRKDEVDKLIQLSFSGTRSAIKADGKNDTNSLKYVRYRYKETSEGDDSYCSFRSIIAKVISDGTNFSFESNELLELDTETSYNFHLQVRDQLDSYGSYDSYELIFKGTPIVSMRKRNSKYDFPRVGINNPAPSEALDVNGNEKISGNLDVGGKICAESGYTSIIIPAGSNLNDYRVPNIYSGSFIGKMINIPPDLSTDSTAAFKLEVYRSGAGIIRIQRLTTTIGAVITTYERYYNSEGKWNDWYCIYRSGKAGNSVLWSGAYYMKDTHTITLSQPISLQPNGIVLVFSYYNATESAAEDVQFKEFFVPKTIVASKPGKGHCFDMSSYKYTACCTKYLYISDSQIKGHADNVAKGTAATGITYNNTYYVLRYVLGV